MLMNHEPANGYMYLPDHGSTDYGSSDHAQLDFEYSNHGKGITTKRKEKNTAIIVAISLIIGRRFQLDWVQMQFLLET